jgi:hypothetical protein
VKRASIIAVIRGHARAPVQRLRRSTRLVRGTYASKGGKSIIATRSTAAGGKISRIVPRLEGPVATPRIDTHYVVTEFGSASLEGLSSTERAHARSASHIRSSATS